IDLYLQDEVLAISEKVVLRLDDLITWITVDTVWTWGRVAKWKGDVQEPKSPDGGEDGNTYETMFTSNVEFSDIEKESRLLDEDTGSIASVVILSYPQYCRYRAMMKRLDGVEQEFLNNLRVKVLGGFASSKRNTRVLFCRDTFDYPELEGHELLCNHLAPKLKGRPRGKRKKRSVSPGSESNESECSVSATVNFNAKKITSEGRINGILSPSCSKSSATRRSTRSSGSNESREFVDKLSAFMRSKRMPLSRIPILGYRELNLHALYTKVVKLGGYETVTVNRLWKSIFDDLSGSYTSTSAATIIRRHYERLLLPYEKHMKGEEFKPSRITETRKKSSSGSCSDAEASESTNSSGNCTPVPQPSTSGVSHSSFSDTKETFSGKAEGKTSSLRSIRVKPERLRDGSNKEKTVDTSDSDRSESLESKSVTKVTINLAGDVTVQKSNVEIKEEVEDKDLEQNQTPESDRLVQIDVKKEEEDGEEEDNKKEADYKTPSPKKELSSNEDDRKHSIDSLEVPCKNVNVVADDEKPESEDTLLHAVKKRKLDILKEGGLEVTPVKTSNVQIKENRPSVIQQNHPNSPHLMNTQISVSLMPENKVESIKIPTYQRRNSTTKKDVVSPTSKDSFLYQNGKSPPIVLQSRSIYSYSEKTVYGNPKDFSSVTVAHTPYTPKYYGHSGGDILDLTVKSPNKPVSEIERMSNVVISSQLLSSIKDITSKSNTQKNQPSLPLLGAKIGSNLEITLVGPNANGSKPSPFKYNGISAYEPLVKIPNVPQQQQPCNNSNEYPKVNSYSKRKGGAKIEENGRYINSIPAFHHQALLYRDSSRISSYHSNNNNNNNNINSNPRHHYHSRTSSKSETNNNKNLGGVSAGGGYGVKQVPSPSSPLLPSYLNPLTSLTNKMIAPYPLAAIDPVYYSALQNLYPHGALPAVPPFFPTREQMQLYTEMMSHSAQLRYPFPFSQGNSQSTTDKNSKQ
ncbi:AT-rich interactive domain-containing protein 5B, partial [Agrilus planipennis]|uniref:AT-rich interactive domain-containing protein 5B n=1 Tax=Agrilus planipennis TaxID=224129 RepID=A0A1W4X776_AGRPL